MCVCVCVCECVCLFVCLWVCVGKRHFLIEIKRILLIDPLVKGYNDQGTQQSVWADTEVPDDITYPPKDSFGIHPPTHLLVSAPIGFISCCSCTWLFDLFYTVFDFLPFFSIFVSIEFRKNASYDGTKRGKEKFECIKMFLEEKWWTLLPFDSRLRLVASFSDFEKSEARCGSCQYKNGGQKLNKNLTSDV